MAGCNPTSINITIIECKFSNHDLGLSGRSEEEGVIFLQGIYAPHSIVMDGIVIESNNASGILASDYNILFSGSSRISNNTALTGAGLNLIDSTIHFTPGASLAITGNTANQTGGGIQIDFSEYKYANDMCFYYKMQDSQTNTANFTIKNNHALLGGDNVYGYVDACDEFTQQVHVPQNEACRPSSISSEPDSDLCIGTLKESVCNSRRSSVLPECFTTYDVDDIKIYPGEKVSFGVHFKGQLNSSVAGTVELSDITNATVLDEERKQTVGKLGGNITYTFYPTEANESAGFRMN